MTRKSRWSQEEIDFVMENEGKLSYEEIGEKIGRTSGAVKTKLEKLDKEVNGEKFQNGDTNKKSFNLKEWIRSHRWETGIIIVLVIFAIQTFQNTQTSEKIEKVDEKTESINESISRIDDYLSENFTRVNTMPVDNEIRELAENALKQAKKDYDRGISYLALGRCPEALEQLKRVTNLNPKNEDAWFFRAQAHYCLGEYQEVINSCNNVSNKSPNYIVCLDGVGMSLLSLKGVENAM